MTFRLLSYNVRYGGTGREAQIAAVIAATRPDLVVFQEATRPRVVERLAHAAGMGAWGARAGHSLGFASRTEPALQAWHWPRSARHAFLEIVPASSSFRIMGVHLAAVHSAWTERRRAGEARALLDAVAAERASPHLLVGDFNTLAPGEVLDVGRLPLRLRPFVWVSGGRIRWHVIQLLLDAGYVDLFRSHNDVEPGFTFPTWDPHLRLDYAFSPRPWADSVTGCQVVTDPPARAASDHFPLLVQFELPPE